MFRPTTVVLVLAHLVLTSICAVGALPSSQSYDSATMIQDFTMDWFLLFGDSITQHAFNQDRGFAWAAQWADTYVRRLDVINRGFSGYNTRQGLEVLPHVVPNRLQTRVKFMTFFFGANDARLPNTPGEPQQHIPLDEFERNTRAMVTHPDVRGHEGIRLILITPPPTDERLTLKADTGNGLPKVIRRKAEVTKKYAEAVCKVGEELNIPVLDLWKAIISRSGGSLVDPIPIGSIDMPQNDALQSHLYDGLHISAKGAKVLYEELLKLVKSTWPDQAPDVLPFVIPRYDDPNAWINSNKTGL